MRPGSWDLSGLEHFAMIGQWDFWLNHPTAVGTPREFPKVATLLRSVEVIMEFRTYHQPLNVKTYPRILSMLGRNPLKPKQLEDAKVGL